MCNFVSLRKTEEQIEDRFNAQMNIPLLYEPYYFRSGFDHSNLFIITQEQTDRITPATWGFVPDFASTWIDSFHKKYDTLNARSETIIVSNTYSQSISSKRCLIIADGFFEPFKLNDVSYPHFCQYLDQGLFAFAGVYNTHDDDLHSCSIITKKANDFFSKVHNNKLRMPMVLDQSFELEWLRRDLNKKGIEDLIEFGFTKEKFEAFPVTKDVNKVSLNRNVPSIIEPQTFPELDMYKQLFS